MISPTPAEGNLIVPGNDVIPEMEMSTSWKQPARNEIAFEVSPDMTMPIITNIPVHAYVWKITLNELREYSTTTPSGVYPGKMWKAEWGGKWYLCWYADSKENPGIHCSIHHCPIILMDVIAALSPSNL